METTLYKSYKKKGTRLSYKQYLLVGLQAKKLYEQIFGELPPKTEQQEPESINYNGPKPRMVTYSVFTYPETFQAIIFNLIDEMAKKKVKPQQEPVNA